MNDIGVLTEGDYPDFVRIQAEAYPGMKIVSQEDRDREVENLGKALEDKRLTWYGAYRDGRLVGGMRVHDFTMNVRGAKVLAGGVGAVAVDLTHKKEHVAKDLIEFYLDHYYDKGAPVAVLWPFHTEFYRRMGFGIGARMYQYRLKPSSLPRGETKTHIRFLSNDDIPALNACYNRLVDRRTGMIEETEAEWQRLVDRGKDIKIVGYEEAGKIRGFMLLRFQSNNSRNFLDNDLRVIEMAYETPATLQELLTFLHTQFDQVKRIILHTPEDEFYYLLNDPYNDSGNFISLTYQESHVSGVGIMYRILSCRRIFEILHDHDFGGVTLKLKLTVRDSFFPRNHGSLVLHVAKGRVSVSDAGDYEVEISMDIAEFSSMFMGAIEFRTLVTYGLADITNSSYLDVVHQMFATSEKPLCMTPF